VRSAVAVIDVVREGPDVLGIAVVVLERDVDVDQAILPWGFALDVDYLGIVRRRGAV
jgi:hypothetical protein